MRMNDLDLPRSEIDKLVGEYVYIVRNKNIFYKKLEGSTYEEIAEEYNLSTQRTKEIVKDCLNKISRHMK